MQSCNSVILTRLIRPRHSQQELRSHLFKELGGLVSQSAERQLSWNYFDDQIIVIIV